MDMKEKAFGYIDKHRDSMMKMWEELVMMDSGSGNKPGVDAIVAKVVAPPIISVEMLEPRSEILKNLSIFSFIIYNLF